MPSFRRRSFVPSLVVLAAVQTASAQCANQWLPGEGVPGIQGAVQAAVIWDPDDTGPQTPKLVLGGNFASAGNTVAHNVATWDPATREWGVLGTGMSSVTSLAVLPGGRLVANGLWRWNGVTWFYFGHQQSTATTTFRTGKILSSYQASYWGGPQIGHVFFTTMERWNGTSWAPIASFWPEASSASRLFSLHNGDFVAAGQVPGGITRHNGRGWRAMSSGLPGSGLNGDPRFMVEHSSGTLIFGGDFTMAGGSPANHIARCDGTAWSPLGAGTNGTVLAGLELPEGDLIVGGAFTTAGGVPAKGVARWDGTAWSPLGAGIDGRVEALVLLPSGDLVAAGQFTTAGNVVAHGVARWDGATWSPLSASAPAMQGEVMALEQAHNGDLVATGVAGEIRSWNDIGWSTIGNATLGMPWLGGVGALKRLPNGQLIVGGSFTAIDAVPANGIASWDGASWTPLGSGTSNTVAALTSLQNGDVIAAGGFNSAGGVPANFIARWNGSTWSPLGAGTGGALWAVTTMPNGDVVAGGYFTTAGTVAAASVARYNGTSWAPLGAGINGFVLALVAMPNGDLIAGGSFQIAGGVPARGIARWDGVSWSPLGSGVTGEVRSLTVLPNGDLIAGGVFPQAGGVVANSIARWDGVAWSALDDGVNGPVNAVRFYGGNQLAVGGRFGTAGSQVSAFVARLMTTCSAAAATLNTSCVGPSGPVTLTATALPWVGSTFASTASGFAPNALAVVLVGGTSPHTPLTWIHPSAGPGCELFASQDAVALRLPLAGSVAQSFSIPSDPAFAGVELFHQCLQFEFGANNQLTALSSSNGLALTIGSF